MPRFPEVSHSVQAMPDGVFSKVAHRIATSRGALSRMWATPGWSPPKGANAELFGVGSPRMHRYRPWASSLRKPSRASGMDRGRSLSPRGPMGLGALSCAWSPGDEVLILSLLAAHSGIVQLHHGVPVEVPVLGFTIPSSGPRHP